MAITEEKIQTAMQWLRAYLKDGDKPPVKRGGVGEDARRYYRLDPNDPVPDAAASPERLRGIGMWTLSIAGKRLGVIRRRSGPRGGWRWHLPPDARGLTS